MKQKIIILTAYIFAIVVLLTPLLREVPSSEQLRYSSVQPINGFEYVFSYTHSSYAVTFFLAMMSLLAFHFLLNKYYPKILTAGLWIYVSSPSFLNLINHGEWSLCIILLCTAFALPNIISIFIASTLGWVPLICVSAACIKKYKLLIFAVPAAAITYFFEPVLPAAFDISIFADLGSTHGFGLFIIILSLMGFTYLWKKREKLRFIPPLLLILYLFRPGTIYLLYVAVPILAAGGAYSIHSTKWKLEPLKTVSVYIIILGVMFSLLSAINISTQAAPDKEMVESLEWLSTQKNGTVLVHPLNAYTVQSVSGKNVFPDPNSVNYEEQLRVAEAIFNSLILKNTTNMLDRNHISYIWIESKTRRQIWREEDEGLLFLFRNKRFSNIYREAGIEIWHVE